MMITLYIVGGLLLLFIGGEVLVRGAVGLAKTLGLSNLVIGLTVVAFGTSSPELMVSVQSALQGYPDIALGNVIGSNISNILLVLGLTALIYPIKPEKGTVTFDGNVMMIGTIIMIVCCITSMMLSFLEGIGMFALLLLYLFVSFKKAHQDKKQADTKAITEEIEAIEQSHLSPLLSVIFAIAGIILLIVGAEFLVKGGVDLARVYGIPESVIGVTIIAIGSSAPELATCVVAACRKHSDIAIGNIIGSNIFNIIGIMGITSIVTAVPVNQTYIQADLWVLLGVTMTTWLIVRCGHHFSRNLGAVFVGGYVAYLLYQYTLTV